MKFMFDSYICSIGLTYGAIDSTRFYPPCVVRCLGRWLTYQKEVEMDTSSACIQTSYFCCLALFFDPIIRQIL
jgi:hypothetical protein